MFTKIGFVWFIANVLDYNCGYCTGHQCLTGQSTCLCLPEELKMKLGQCKMAK